MASKEYQDVGFAGDSIAFYGGAIHTKTDRGHHTIILSTSDKIELAVEILDSVGIKVDPPLRYKVGDIILFNDKANQNITKGKDIYLKVVKIPLIPEHQGYVLEKDDGTILTHHYNVRGIETHSKKVF